MRTSAKTVSLKTMVKAAVLFVLAAMIAAPSPAGASDKNKRRLYQIFFLPVNKDAYTLIIRRDKTFILAAPDGRKCSGRIQVSDKYLTLRQVTNGRVAAQRYFRYRLKRPKGFRQKNLQLSRRPDSRENAVGLLGEIPPNGLTPRAVFICKRNWLENGQALPRSFSHASALETPKTTASARETAGGETPRAPAPPATTTSAVAPPPGTRKPRPPAPAFTSWMGTYVCPLAEGLDTAKGHTATLRLQPDGTFHWLIPNGRNVVGVYFLRPGELVLEAGTCVRRFLVKKTETGLVVERSDTDVPKSGDLLGEIPPLDRKPLPWRRAGSESRRENTSVAPVASTPVPAKKTGPVSTSTPQPPKTVPAAEIQTKTTKPTNPVTKSTPKATPTPPTPPTRSAANLSDFAGNYILRVNPLAWEKLALRKNGTFTYSDSNEAKVTGTVTLLKDGRLHFQAGKVKRIFGARRKKGALILTRDAEDNPDLFNDLAAMSPTVFKNATYRLVPAAR